VSFFTLSIEVLLYVVAGQCILNFAAGLTHPASFLLCGIIVTHAFCRE